MNARLQTVVLPENRRMIAVRDLHGNLPVFRALLKQLNFTEADILVIVGDILEKGPDSLGLLRYVMRLAETHTVYEVCGNCDDFADEILEDGTPEQEEELLVYLLDRKQSVLNEMCAEIGFAVQPETNMAEMKRRLRASFQKEFAYLASLPDILDTQHFTFVHAALRPGSLERQDREFCLCEGNFLNSGCRFEKPCVVGHWPVCLYRKEICHNPIIDREHNIYSIDGGNVLKSGGQINAVILPPDGNGDVSFTSRDGLEKAVALKDSTRKCENPVRFYWVDGRVEKIREENGFSLCRHVASGKEAWIPTNWLFARGGKWFTDDFTDECLSVRQGEVVSLIEKTAKGYFIKKDGVCGWYYGGLEPV